LATEKSPAAIDSDAETLRALGYESHFDRTMTKWENFSLGFTYLSPVVGVYTIFATAIVAGGPPMWWTYIGVGLGQLLVCLIFGEIVSQFPISGGLYPWARRLMGKRWAWMAGWIYAWALCCTMAGVATGVAPFLAQLFGRDGTAAETTAIALFLIVVSTALNLSGTRLLARVAMFGFICELVGAIVVGGYLLLFARHQPLEVLLDTSVVHTDGNYLPAFLASSLAAMFCYYGFEACGDVAEETPDASRMIPKAMRMTIYIGGAAAIWVCLAFVLSIPDMGAVLSGADKDPIVTLLRSALGETGFRAVIVVVLVSFVSCLLSLQAAASPDLCLRARSNDLRQQAPESHVARTTCTRERAAAHGRHPRGHRPLGAVASGCDRDHHQFRGRRHLHLVSNDRVGGPARALQGLAARGSLHARSLGHSGECLGPALRRQRHRQHSLAAQPE